MNANAIHTLLFVGKIVLTIFLIIMTFFLSKHFLKKKTKYLEDCDLYKKNFILVLVLTINTIILGVVFYCLWGIFQPETIAKVDWIIGIATVIGIIGAAWAVLARIDAENAFREAKSARLTAEKTLNALGNTFPFFNILDVDKIAEIFFQIKRDEPLENIDISLYLGFPCIGYLYKNKEEFKHNSPEEVFLKFKNFIRDLNELLVEEKVKGLTFRIAVFSKTGAKNLLSSKKLPQTIYAKRNANDDLLESFYIELEKLKNHSTYDVNGKPIKDQNRNLIIIKNGKCTKNSETQTEEIIEDFNLNEKFRFIVFDHKKKDAIPTKAFIWVLPDIKDAEGFESAAFQTKDFNFISVLESVFV